MSDVEIKTDIETVIKMFSEDRPTVFFKDVVRRLNDLEVLGKRPERIILTLQDTEICKLYGYPIYLKIEESKK